MTAKSRFTQADVTRLLKGVRAAGLEPAKIEVDLSGKIEVTFGQLDAEPELSLAGYAGSTSPWRRGTRHEWSDDDV